MNWFIRCSCIKTVLECLSNYSFCSISREMGFKRIIKSIFGTIPLFIKSVL